ncbi:MAG: hypothetical protein NTY37_05160 [Methanothrix sp.]|nr:hypothetical protein [Methanothrix sp.]
MIFKGIDASRIMIAVYEKVQQRRSKNWDGKALHDAAFAKAKELEYTG